MKTLFGFLTGLILPVITSVLFYNFSYAGNLDYRGFIEALLFLDSVSMLFAVCCLSNLAVFLIVVNLNFIKFSRGLFLATIMYALAVVVLKFGIQ
ncbi:MAG: hypothetical protein J6Y82_04870 [Bacteroidales bacterium]|nr:hypothetical protein [Bacteroidales bacterium]